MKKTININCDLGEGGKLDSQIMPLISSCNIACGGHFGDDKSIKNAMQLAQKHSVLVGAHPSFPDLKNFGRITLQMNPAELKNSLHEQLTSFYKIANELKIEIHHVKPHGALYHEVALNSEMAQLFLEVVNHFSKEIILYTAPNSALSKLNISKNRIHVEVFADRAYHNNGNLVSRSEANAVLTESKQVAEQVLNLALHQKVKSREGEAFKFDFDTLCFHSDSPNALKNLQLVNTILQENHIQIEKVNA
ncbi:5-oxoprolinase subunit PxpA [Psychroflexus planctonicus]|uniref:LamB/YcsF family protein n=1 Tax=Psychroflexus planctonicus TaxID=1526575 RepID=A0ABQ1SG54_9FLAO|nr:5-oxoprolinase subunit PxpA [Psychroflexus planctonicus]GGE30092.1 LamB/YcsF family protein [Psychroflexus planctonicus]